MATVTKYPQSNAVITTGWTTPNNAHADDDITSETFAGQGTYTVSSGSISLT